jgi:vacuolar-type H+-ATPase subunit D/Vma8
MRSRLADTESALKESKTSQKRSEENYNTLKRSVDNLMNDFLTVKAKVTAAKL